MNINDFYLYNFLQNLQTQGKRKYVPGQYGYGYVPGQGGYAWKAGNEGKLASAGAYFKGKGAGAYIPGKGGFVYVPGKGAVGYAKGQGFYQWQPGYGVDQWQSGQDTYKHWQPGSGQGVQEIPVAQTYTENSSTPTGLAASPEMLITYLVALDNYLKNRGKV